MTQKQTETISLVAKLCGDGEGPVVLSEGERARLHSAFSDVTQENLQRRLWMSAIGEALQRNNLKITHIEHDDGSVGFDLENATNDENVTVN
jgi:hypothetical protein